MGNGAARLGNSRWRRLTEERAGGAKSVFHFDVQGSVAKSTHAGIPWLRFIRQRLGDRVHFWPFDGWDIPGGRSAVVEVYPALWSRGFARARPHRRPARCLFGRRVDATCGSGREFTEWLVDRLLPPFDGNRPRPRMLKADFVHGQRPR